MSRLKRNSPNFNDIIGTVIERLTVSEYLYSEANKQGIGHHHYYKCNCSCGNTHTVRRQSLLKKEVKSCGCLRLENLKSHFVEKHEKNSKEHCLKSLYRIHRNQANYRGIDFNISKELHSKLILENCHYCGLSPYNTYKGAHGIHEFKYNGIDRMNGNEGYTENNVVTCCLMCNKAKNTMDYKEFIEYIRRLVNFNRRVYGVI